jgi:plastocyanin
MRTVLLLLGVALVTGAVSTSCSSGGGGGAGGGGAAGGSGGSGGSAGGTAGGAAGGTEMADADAGLCDPVALTCTSYEDHSAPDAGRTVEFGTVNGFAAVPQCMQIKKGQTVIINSGAFHPVVQDCGPVNRKLNAPESMMTTLRFDVAGDYMYHCDVHLFTGFIKVTP